MPVLRKNICLYTGKVVSNVFIEQAKQVEEGKHLHCTAKLVKVPSNKYHIII